MQHIDAGSVSALCALVTLLIVLVTGFGKVSERLARIEEKVNAIPAIQEDLQDVREEQISHGHKIHSLESSRAIMQRQIRENSQ